MNERKGAILIPEQVANEVAFHPMVRKSDPVKVFVEQNPALVTNFQGDEEEEYLRILKQPAIGEGEAAAIAIASRRALPLVIDEKETKARGKAHNHGVKTLTADDFLEGRLP
ncbi:MAG: hypothetical protein ACRD2L_00980 [Terriglobia bacterium]